jgi:hypothetical protein
MLPQIPDLKPFQLCKSSESKKPSGDLFCNTLHIPKSHTITGFEGNPIYQISVANIEAPTFPAHHVVGSKLGTPNLGCFAKPLSHAPSLERFPDFLRYQLDLI